MNLWLSSLYKKILIQIYIYIHIKLRKLNKRSQRREKKEEKWNWEFLRLLDRFVYHLIIKYNFNKHSITAESCSRDPIFSHLDGGRDGNIFETKRNGREGEKGKHRSIEKSLKRFNQHLDSRRNIFSPRLCRKIFPLFPIIPSSAIRYVGFAGSSPIRSLIKWGTRRVAFGRYITYKRVDITRN